MLGEESVSAATAYFRTAWTCVSQSRTSSGPKRRWEYRAGVVEYAFNWQVGSENSTSFLANPGSIFLFQEGPKGPDERTRIGQKHNGILQPGFARNKLASIAYLETYQVVCSGSAKRGSSRGRGPTREPRLASFGPRGPQNQTFFESGEPK